MSAIDPLPATGDDAAQGVAPRVSTRLGWWSVGLALGSALVFWVIAFFVVGAVAGIFRGITSVPPAVASGVYIGISVLVAAMVIAAMILGVISIVRAWRQVGQSGRTAAIVLGCIGIVLGALMGLYLSLPFLPI